MEKPIPIMIRLLYPTAAALLLCCLLSVTGLQASNHPFPCLDDWEEGAYPPSSMASMTVNCPFPILESLPNNGCTVTIDLQEPTANCTIFSITNDFNGMATIPEQDFGEGTFEITWTLDTECDGIFTCTQLVVVEDNTAPIFVCPSSATEQCSADDMVAFASIEELVTAGATIMDNCQLDSTYLLVGEPVLIDAGPCPMIYERTYTVKDTSGNEAMCMQTIHVNDTTNPIFDCPANITVSTTDGACSAEIVIPSIDVTDNCGTVSVTNSLSVSSQDLVVFPVGDTPIKFYAEDACGNIDSCETIITVLDNTPPSMTCADNDNAACSAAEISVFTSYAEFIAANGSATDNCGSIDESTFGFVSESSDELSCPETVTRIYTIMDDSGNSATCEQTIMVSENEPPTFTVPLDTIVDCGSNIDTMNVGIPTDVADNCGSTGIILSFTDEIVLGGDCPVISTITRSWTAVDICGNMSEAQNQIITIQDTIKPVAVCKLDTLYLDQSGEVDFDINGLDGGSFDACGEGALIFTSDFDFSSCNDAMLMQDIVFTVTDVCGNSDTCMTSILVLDTIPATLTCPQNMLVTCPSDLPGAYLTYEDFEGDGGLFTDNCQSNLPSQFYLSTEEQVGETCPYNIVRTYVAADNNGNIDSCVHTLTVEDTELPVVTCPADMMITGTMNTCDTILVIPVATAADACGITSITNDYNGGGADASGTYSGGETIVTFTATDACGNIGTCAMTITVDVDPALACPDDVTVQCDLTEEPIFTSFAQFMEAGGRANLGCGAVTTGFAHMGDILISTNSCTQVYERTYGLPGMMGDMFACTYQITVTDDEVPVITCPAAINVNAELDQCSANVDLSVMATDNCGSVTVTNDFTTETSADFPVGTTIVTFTATDDCDNIASCTMNVTVSDAQAPYITCPDGAFAMCDASSVPVYSFYQHFVDADANSSIDDNCAIDTTTFAYEGEMELTIFGMTIISRTYSIEDLAGNASSCTQTIIVMDSTEPFVTCPGDVTVETDPGLCTATVSNLIAITEDNCLVDTIYNSRTGDGADASGVYSVGETVVTFTVADEEGNSSECSFTVTVEDNILPVLTCPDTPTPTECGVEDNVAYTSFLAFQDAGGMADDICGIDTSTFAVVSDLEVSRTDCSVTYERIYSIEDNNGNVGTCTQSYQIEDSTAPTITCPSNVMLSTDTGTCTANSTVTVTATDFCTGDIPVTNNFNASIDGVVTADFAFGETVIIFSATDDCNLTSTCTVVITVVDEEAPLVTFLDIPSAADTVEVMCNLAEAMPIQDFDDLLASGGQVTDNCMVDDLYFSQLSPDVLVTGSDPTTYIRSYVIADASGNLDTLEQIIIVQDTNIPTVIAPDDLTVDCDDDLSDPQLTGTAMTNDNCTPGSLTVSINDEATVLDCPNDSLILRIFTVVDDAGNTAIDTQRITKIDDEAPVFDANTKLFSVVPSTVEDTVACNDNFINPVIATAVDACGTHTIAVDTLPFVTSVCSGYQVNYRYIATDACMNSDTVYSGFWVAADTMAPAVTVLDTFITINTELGLCTATVTLPIPTVLDNCSEYVIENSVDGEDTLTTTFILGETMVTYTITDQCGNSTEVDQTVTVIDEEAPVISFSDDPMAMDTVNVMCNLSEAIAIADVAGLYAAGGNVTDNCMVDNPTFTMLADNLVVGSNPTTYIRSYEIADESGNLDTLLQVIIIQDTETPSLTVPGDITLACDDDTSDTALTGIANADDNCTVDLVIDINDEATVLGCPNDSLILRIFTVMDDAGNTAIDTQRITKIDEEAPVFDANAKLFSAIPTVVDDTVACNEGFIDPILASAVDACGVHVIVVDTLPYISTVCSGYQVNYRYIAIDACMNADTVYSGFWVSKDTTAPVVTALDTFINLTTDPGECTATATLPIPSVLDDCSDYVIVNSINGEDTLTSSFTKGETTFSYTITDDCGNVTVVDQTVIVTDEESPVVVCRTTPIQVSVSSDINMVLASSFILDATDNCGYADVQVRRINDLCSIAGNEMLGDTVFFCCEDVGAIHEIEVIVTDESGNQNSCIALAEVSDKIKPSFLIPVPDVTVSCDYPLDLTDLDDFGTFVLTGDDREEIIINDTAYVNSNGLVGLDGVYKENCPDGTVVSTEVLDMTTNGQGIIMRIFTITDASGNTATYTQRIFVEDFNPFSEQDITWPEDITVEGCEDDVPTLAQGGIPTFTNINKCHEIQYSSTDLVFDNPTSGCVYIRRTFKVIDSNIYDPSVDPDNGIWTNIQDIFMTNSVKPEFVEACSDTLICAQGTGCSALVELSVSATDDCTDIDDLEYSYTLDTDNNGTIDISGIGNSLSEMLPQGFHKVTFTVSDRCGNTETCVRVVEVRECKPPSVACIALAMDLSPIDGTVQIWASDFNASSSDNCTDTEDLLFSFSSDPTEFGRTFNCDSLGIREVEIWVTDEAGNQSFCVTTVDVQDNTNACGNGLNQNTMVMGQVSTQNNMPISNATIVIDGPEMNQDIMTDDQGGYVFADIPMYNDYVITPSKDDEHLKGVSTLDLVLIQRHILALNELSSPYDIIAADINASQTVSGADVIELRKMILGVQDEFNNNESFRFVESNYVFADVQDPFPFMEETEFDEVDKTMVQSDFVAIKIGDVNGSIEDGLTNTSEVETRSDNAMTIYTNNQHLQVGETVIIPIYTADVTSLVGLQFTVDYDSDYLEFVSADGGQIELDNSQVADHRNESKTTVAWSSFEAKSDLDNSEPLAYFAYTVKRNGKLRDVWSITSDITDALAYDATYQKHEIDLRFDNTSTPSFAMFQNQPNPFTEYTEVIFELPKSEEVSLQVFDNTGKLVHRQSSRYTAGKHQIRLNTEQLTKSGIYYYKIKAGEYSEARKMLKIK